MPMLMVHALTRMLLLGAFDVDAYALAADANADTKMPIVARQPCCRCLCYCDVVVNGVAAPMLLLLR